MYVQTLALGFVCVPQLSATLLGRLVYMHSTACVLLLVPGERGDSLLTDKLVHFGDVM